MNKKAKKTVLFIFVGICILLSFSCAKLISVKPAEEEALKMYAPLGKVYKKIIVQKFEIDQDLENEFPEAIITCESTAMNELLKKNAAPIIEKARLSTSKDAEALIVKTRITTLKMASASARGLSGEFVGKSEMAADVKLIDAQTRKTLRKDNLSTANIPSSSPNAILSERVMPSELGKMIAEYIAQALRDN